MTDSPSTSSLARLRPPDAAPFPSSRGSKTCPPPPYRNWQTTPLVTLLHYFGPLRRETLAAEFEQHLGMILGTLEWLSAHDYVERVPAVDGFGFAWDSTRRWLPDPDEDQHGDEG